MSEPSEYFIVSDIHLGSQHCLASEFKAFAAGLPPGATLVLNGDTIDRVHDKLPPEHEEVLDLLRKESLKRKIVWVRGNHDDDYVMPEPGAIEFAKSFSIGKRLHVSHGYDFDNVMPYHKWFIITFRMFHHLRVRLGAESVHVAFYAKQFRWLYNVLLRFVSRNAVEHARENGFAAVTCGHTHFVQDIMIDGVRYINTGAWTEKPAYCLYVSENEMKLKTIVGG